MRARALADSAALGLWLDAADSLDQAQQALAIAREVDDPALLARALTACGLIAGYYDPEAGPGVFRRSDRPGPGIRRPVAAQPNPRRASRRCNIAADPLALRAAAEEGRDLADAIGDRFGSRMCRYCLALAQVFQGDLARAATQFAELLAEARAAHDGIVEATISVSSFVLAFRVRRLRPGPPPTRPSRLPPSLAGLERASPTGRWPTRPWPPAMLRRRRTRPRRLATPE